MEEKKFVCKFCSKRFSCGKSLGGHIRTHMSEQRNNNINANADANANDAECDNVDLDAVKMKQKRDNLWCEAGYGLRENPKKTMRFVHSKAKLEQQQQEEKFCKECGKGFPSLKALCGHMACHSEKQKLVMDSQSDTEESCEIPKNPRRSKRMKFKTVTISNNDHTYCTSVSEVDQEQEEVARCLMLLANDSSHKGPFALITESSENFNSVVVEETKSSSVDFRNGINKFVTNGYDLVENKELKLKSAADNSDSGYFRYDPQTKVAKSGVSKDEFKPEFDDYDVESGKVLKMNKERSKYTVTLFKKSVKKDLDYDGTGGTTSKFDSFNHSKKKITNGFDNDEIYENGEKGLKFESLTYDSTYESDENSSDSDSFPAPKSHSSKVLNGKKSNKAKKKLKSKKSKEHECPICYKIFKSGQALGGHKRSHFVGGSEENTVIINQGHCLIDLNLPAPIDE